MVIRGSLGGHNREFCFKASGKVGNIHRRHFGPQLTDDLNGCQECILRLGVDGVHEESRRHPNSESSNSCIEFFQIATAGPFR